MNILLYYPSNATAVSLSSLLIAFREQGHSVFLLTQSPEGALHREVKPFGVQTFSIVLEKKNPFLFYYRHIKHLVKFIKEHKIDVVYSHLQQANMVAVHAQKFCKARIFICRHHSDSAYVEPNKNAKRFDRVINRLGKEFIVPSQKVYRQMTEVEKVDPKKIHLIRYAYDFSGYPLPDKAQVTSIREKYKADLLLVKVARLIPEKRHQLLFRVIQRLVKEGKDIKLIVLSSGSLEKELKAFVKVNRLEKNIFFTGMLPSAIDFLAAADAVVHVSASEASSNLAKETGLAEKALIACHDVGDFDEYLVSGENSILISKENAEGELYDILTRIYSDRSVLSPLGPALKKDVLELFSIEKVIAQYAPFHK